jgi:hypothetical protein
MSLKYRPKKIHAEVGPVTREDLNHVPNRFWMRSESGGWYSVARNSPAHLVYLQDQVRQPLMKEWWP